MVPCAMVERGQNLHLGYDAKNKDKICYPSRAGIVIRSLTNPTDADIFTGFRGISNTTVAKFSPSGYYVCAGSKGGWVKVFGSKRNDEGDYIVKAEYEVLSGPPKDLAWDGESKRICVVGDGSETYTRAFIVDSGASTGGERSTGCAAWAVQNSCRCRDGPRDSCSLGRADSLRSDRGCTTLQSSEATAVAASASITNLRVHSG